MTKVGNGGIVRDNHGDLIMAFLITLQCSNNNNMNRKIFGIITKVYNEQDM